MDGRVDMEGLDVGVDMEIVYVEMYVKVDMEIDVRMYKSRSSDSYGDRPLDLSADLC